jgi:hypothetical protein
MFSPKTGQILGPATPGNAHAFYLCVGFPHKHGARHPADHVATGVLCHIEIGKMVGFDRRNRLVLNSLGVGNHFATLLKMGGRMVVAKWSRLVRGLFTSLHEGARIWDDVPDARA